MASVEQFVTGISQANALLSHADLYATHSLLEEVGNTLQTVSSDAPVMQEAAIRLQEAHQSLLRAIGRISNGQGSIQTYLREIGAKTPAFTIPQELPTKTTQDERAQTMDKLRELLSVRSNNCEDIRELLDSQHRTIRDTLRSTGMQREQLLSTLEQLLYTNHEIEGTSEAQARRLRDIGILTVNTASSEMMALATQTTDMALANRVEDLLFTVSSHRRGITCTTPELRKLLSDRAIPYVRRHLDSWNTAREHSVLQDIDTTVKAVVNIIHRNTGDGRQTIFSGLVSIANENGGMNSLFIDRFLEQMSEEWGATASGFLEGVGGFDNTEEIAHAWEVGCREVNTKNPELDKKGVRLNHMRTIFQLEQFKRGATGQLYRSLRIRNFGRYPHRLLIETCKVLDRKVPKPESYSLYGTVIASNNKAFELDHTNLQDVYIGALGVNHGIIPFEFSNEHDILQLEATIRAAGFGQANDIIVNSHGKRDGLTLHQLPKERYNKPHIPVRLTSQDIANPERGAVGRVLGRLVKPLGRIVIAACSTASGGYEGSFAWHLHKASERKVIAPTIPTAAQVKPPEFYTDVHLYMLPVTFYEDYTNDVTHNPFIFPTPDEQHNNQTTQDI